MPAFLEELKRRNVVRVGLAYLVVSWLVLQMGEVIFELLDVPVWAGKLLIAFLVLGLPIALFFAWAFELTPDGIKREKDVDRSQSITHETGRKLNYAIIAILVLAVGFLVVDNYVLDADVPTAAPPGTSQKSIAVLPFENRSAETDTQYFADGIHDDLLTQLARIGDLKVISRTSVLEYRDTQKNMRQIGAELGVATLLEGAVQRAGNRVRINAQLIDAATDDHLWAETFDKELTPDNIFEIQTDIARAIADALAATLVPTALAAHSESAPTQNQDAYDLYLKAKSIERDATTESMTARIALYEEALALDPGFALAAGEMAYDYMDRYWFGARDTRDRDLARRAIERALALDPDSPRLQWIWADSLYHGDLDLDGALAALERAEQGMPGSADVYKLRGWIQRRAGRHDIAIEAIENAINLDPRNQQLVADAIWSYLFTGNLEKARWAGERAMAMDDLAPSLQLWVHSVDAFMLGDLEAMSDVLEKTPDDDLGILRHLALFVPLVERRFDDALERLAGMEADPVLCQWCLWPHSYVRARIALARGDSDLATQEAEAALEDLDRLEQERGAHALGAVARALMYAVLGRDDAARAEADRATELYPIERDRPGGSTYLAERLRVLAIVADTGELAAEMAE
ncbi:MAG: tetratricopeptide repeat protein, partial [Woeseiaceae bacterium]